MRGFLFRFIVTGIAVLVASKVIPGIEIDSLASGLVGVFVLALLNALAILQQQLGSLDRVRSIVRLTGHVASTEGFVQQPAVLNGASDLLVEIFGEPGRHARLALGAFELPLHASVELELIVQVHPGS